MPRKEPLPLKPCRNCGQPKPRGRGRALCDACSAHCGRHEIFWSGCEGCVKAGILRANRKRWYELTDAQLIELESIKRCEVCGSSEKLCVDHDHATGEVRGMLCDLCNKALGHARDDIEILEGLITYLKR